MNIVQQDGLNFLLTNRIPRRGVTRFIGWFSRIEHPMVRDISLRLWGLFADLDLSDAKTASFRSMHDCFTRELKPGARPIDTDPGILVSPCDAIIGASAMVQDGSALQVKGFSYTLAELLGDAEQARTFASGRYITLRLTSSMYHRFHAPYDCHVQAVSHIPGDAWNVNPAALSRVERLFCRNERAVIATRLAGTDHLVTLVPVAAILVAGIRLRFLDLSFRPQGRTRRTIHCHASIARGEEMGWFEHGSTIIVLTPEGFLPCAGVTEGATIRVGQPLLHLPGR